MTIFSEMKAFLDDQIEDASMHKQRNIDLICYYYGFGDAELPTLDEVAQRYVEFESRENVRLILNKYFRDVATLDQLPSVRRFQELLSSQPYWSSSILESTVTEADLATEPLSLRGLLRLLDDLKIRPPYNTYSPDIQEKSLKESLKYPKYVLVQVHLAPDLHSLLQLAKNFPGDKGIARIEDLEEASDAFAAEKKIMLQLIRNHPDSWMRKRSDGLWYLFEDRDNSLINSCRKALTAFEECDLAKLAQSSQSLLRRRSNRYTRPPVDLIEDYLRTSRHFAVDEGTVRRPPSFRPVRLNDIEEDLIQYFRAHREVRYEAARAFLEGKRYARVNISQALTMSPLVFVDRALGRQNHMYYTVEPLDSGQPEQPTTENRYSEFRDRLHELRDTDSTSEQSARREQHILGQWLFEGKETEICALCGREFAVEALVTAHKKRRADCNEGERRDPHIVMPLCKFGCDYLYEQQHVYVEEGIVRRGVPLQSGGVEDAHAHELVGRRLEERWLEGQSTYFHRPANEGGQ